MKNAFLSLCLLLSFTTPFQVYANDEVYDSEHEVVEAIETSDAGDLEEQAPTRFQTFKKGVAKAGRLIKRYPKTSLGIAALVGVLMAYEAANQLHAHAHERHNVGEPHYYIDSHPDADLQGNVQFVDRDLRSALEAVSNYGYSASFAHDPVRNPRENVVVFSHGYGGDKYQAVHYMYAAEKPRQDIHYHSQPEKRLFSIANYDLLTFNYREVLRASPSRWEQQLWAPSASMAQGSDIASLRRALETLPNDKKVVGFGVSRGASTWITALGKHPELRSKVKALVLESPFANLNEVVNKFAQRAIGMPANVLGAAATSTGQAVVFPKYSRFGIKPIGVVDKIPTDLPILLVHSMQDRLIPYDHTLQLYKKLREAGNDNVYLLLLRSGGQHANMLFGSQKNLYRAYTQLFLNKYGMPSDLAEANQLMITAERKDGAQAIEGLSTEWFAGLSGTGGRSGYLSLEDLKVSPEAIEKYLKEKE